MLVLSRKVNEKILVPTIGLEMTILEVRRNGTVRIGFSAPPDVPILREEVVNKPSIKEAG